MTEMLKSMCLGFLSLSFVWIVCISICVSIKLLILHIKDRDEVADQPPTEPVYEEKQNTILSTPVQTQKPTQRKRRKEQPAKVYFVMQQEED